MPRIGLIHDRCHLTRGSNEEKEERVVRPTGSSCNERGAIRRLQAPPHARKVKSAQNTRPPVRGRTTGSLTVSAARAANELNARNVTPSVPAASRNTTTQVGNRVWTACAEGIVYNVDANCKEPQR